MSFLSASSISVSISNSDRLYESIFTVEYQQMLIPYDIPFSTMNLSSLSFIDKISRSALADFDLPWVMIISKRLQNCANILVEVIVRKADIETSSKHSFVYISVLAFLFELSSIGRFLITSMLIFTMSRDWWWYALPIFEPRLARLNIQSRPSSSVWCTGISVRLGSEHIAYRR